MAYLDPIQADDNTIFFHSKEKNLQVGNGDFSYTLNRGSNTLNN